MPKKKPNYETPLQAIRKFCVCELGRKKFVKECTDIKCPLFPFRFGKNPYHRMSKLKRSLDNLKIGQKGRDKVPVFETRIDDQA